ncbi:MAG: ankyrin repeat domain-containing protein [Phycisphaerae bacterium]|jgi:ankyrin repeat protein|nr:ankyrin repeat domain-containing protein [Phycisphaerae bacterium]
MRKDRAAELRRYADDKMIKQLKQLRCLTVVLSAILSVAGCQPQLSEGDAKALSEAKAFLAGGGDVNARDEEDWTLMRHAVWNNHLGTMRFLIANGTDLEEHDNCWHYLLHDAALRGRLEAMKLLVEHGAEINAKLTHTECTALHFAAFEGSIDTVRFLVQHKADVNAKGRGRVTPILFAAAGGNYEVVEFLISKGASATAGSKGGATPLCNTAGGHRLLIREYSGEWFHIRIGDTREDLAARLSSLRTCDHGKVVRLLVKSGAKVNESIWYATALHRASFAGNVRAVEALLELGADPSRRTGDELSDDNPWERPGYNALDAAAWSGVRLEPRHGGKLVEALIRAGVKVNQHDGTGKTPLHHAVENLHVDAIKALLKGGANVNGVDKKFVRKDKAEVIVPDPPWYRHNIGTVHYGQTPLFTALKIGFPRHWGEKLRSQMREKRTEVIRLLLDKGADTAVQLSDGATPLHVAVLFANPEEVVDLLLAHGADINATDKGLATPLHYAAARDLDDRRREIVRLGLARLLVSEGASLTARAKTGNMTPLDWALWSKDSGEAKTEISKEFAKILKDAAASEEQDE